MNICLKHSQAYQDFCPYCGHPINPITTATSTNVELARPMPPTKRRKIKVNKRGYPAKEGNQYKLVCDNGHHFLSNLSALDAKCPECGSLEIGYDREKPVIES